MECYYQALAARESETSLARESETSLAKKVKVVVIVGYERAGTPD